SVAGVGGGTRRTGAAADRRPRGGLALALARTRALVRRGGFGRKRIGAAAGGHDERDRGGAGTAAARHRDPPRRSEPGIAAAAPRGLVRGRAERGGRARTVRCGVRPGAATAFFDAAPGRGHRPRRPIVVGGTA